jgi:hypothetical protein
MKLAVQADHFSAYREAVNSQCDGVRFGSEFCEILLPEPEELEEARLLAEQAGKGFTYVTPRLSNAGIERVRAGLALLNGQGESGVVFNDLGTLNMLDSYPNLHPHLGRHLLLVPARTLWVREHLDREDLSLRRREWLRELFSSTSLNYHATVDLYRRFGCRRADIDWIPRTFPSLGFLVEHGMRLSVHLQLIAATITRKCHTARFLGEKSPEGCSKPCLDRAFWLRNEPLDMSLYLHGNAAFRLMEPSAEGVQELAREGVYELVLTMNPLTGIERAQEIDDLMTSLKLSPSLQVD